MKIKEGYLLREVAGQFLVVPVGNQAISFNGIITLNKTGKVIWEVLQKDTSKATILETLLDRFDVTPEQASQDIDMFLSTLQKHQLLE